MPQSMYFKRLSEQNKYIPVQIKYKKIKKKKKNRKKKKRQEREEEDTLYSFLL